MRVFTIILFCSMCLMCMASGAENRELWSKRAIFKGPGVFRKLNPLLSGMYPLNNMVRLSNGCSGMLITSLHVLTAADCVNNMTPQNLRVFITDAMGGSVVYPNSIRVSDRYLHPATQLEATQHNFAVLTLRSRVTRAKVIPLMAVDGVTLSLFKAVHYGGVMRSRQWVGLMSCPVQSSHTAIKLGLLFTPCSLPALTTGSPILVTYPATGERIIGVMSRKLNGKWSIGVAFTVDIIEEICSWLGDSGQSEGVCVKPQSALKVLVRGTDYGN